MHSKNKHQPSALERKHIEDVKSLPCSLCDRPGPSAAHEIKQGQWFTSVALCYDCHQGQHGLHGDRALWRIRKWDEVDALAVTIQRLRQRF